MTEILTLTGAFILFLSWAAQQFLYEAWNARLSEISEAKYAFATYQSHNALFDTISLITPSEQRAQLGALQLKNYQFGLDWLSESLSKERHEQLQSKFEETEAQLVGVYPNEYREYREMQAKIIVIQTEHNQEKATIAARKGTAQRIFWSLYIIGTLLIIASQVFSQVG